MPLGCDHRSSVLGLALGIVLLVPLFGCRSGAEAHYATAEDAQRDGAFARGTLPVILFPDTTDIRELHDFGVEHTGASFHYGDPFVHRLNEKCRRYGGEERVASPFATWPDFINHRQTAAQLEQEKGFSSYHCGTATVLITSEGVGYLWH